MNIYNEQVGNRKIQIPIVKYNTNNYLAMPNQTSLRTVLYYGDKIEVKYVIKNNIIKSETINNTDVKTRVIDKYVSVVYFKPYVDYIGRPPKGDSDFRSEYTYKSESYSSTAHYPVKTSQLTKFNLSFINNQNYLLNAVEIIGRAPTFTTQYDFKGEKDSTEKNGTPTYDPVTVKDDDFPEFFNEGAKGWWGHGKPYTQYDPEKDCQH